MFIDCSECAMQHTAACDDCVVSVLLEIPSGPVELNDEEGAALRNLAEGGLVAPLRLVPRVDDHRAASG